MAESMGCGLGRKPSLRRRKAVKPLRVVLHADLVVLRMHGLFRTTPGRPPIQPMPSSCNPHPILQARRAAAHRAANLTSLGNKAQTPAQKDRHTAADFARRLKLSRGPFSLRGPLLLVVVWRSVGARAR